MLHEGTDLNSFNAFQNLGTIFLNKIVSSKPCQCRSTQKTSLGPLLLIAYHARRGSGHVYGLHTMSGKEAVMYTFIRITYHARRRKRSCIRVYGLHTIPGEGSGHAYMYTDYIPCQEKEAVMYTCIRITYHARRGSGHVYMYTDYIPCQEKEAVMYTCIRIIGTDFVSVSTLF